MQNSNQPSSSPRRGRNAPQASPPASTPSPAGSQASSAGSSDEEIARRAYARWESSDRSHGRDQEHWFAAEEELRGSRNQSGDQADLNRGAGSSGV